MRNTTKRFSGCPLSQARMKTDQLYLSAIKWKRGEDLRPLFQLDNLLVKLLLLFTRFVLARGVSLQ